MLKSHVDDKKNFIIPLANLVFEKENNHYKYFVSETPT